MLSSIDSALVYSDGAVIVDKLQKHLHGCKLQQFGVQHWHEALVANKRCSYAAVMTTRELHNAVHYALRLLASK
eukprot:7816-Heterococcus_DN1.PRE.6